MADESSTVATETVDETPDLSLDAVDEAPTEETETTEPSPAEDTETEAESDEEADKPTPEDKDDNAEESTDEPAEPKLTRKERAERYAEQQQELQNTKQQVEQAVLQAYQPQDVQQLKDYYIDQGADEFQALQLARQDVAEQKAQIAEATTQIAELNANLRVDAVEARAKYDWMNPDSKTYAEGTTKATAELYELATVKDPNTGQIVDVRMTPSQIASVVENIRQEAIKDAKRTAQKNAESQMASVAPPTSARQPVKKSDSLDDMKERLGNISF